MSINDYLVSVVFASGLGILSDIITVSYGKTAKGTEKYVKLAVSLCILACIILPAAKSVDYDALFREYNISQSGENVNVIVSDSLYTLERECEEKTSDYIFEKTGIKPNRIVIDMESGSKNNSVSIIKAEIHILTENKKYEEKVRSAAAEALGTEVDIVYEQ